MGCAGAKSQSPGCQNSSPLTSFKAKKGCGTDQTIIKGSVIDLGINYVGSTIKGWREENQDSFLIEKLSSDIALFGVFDGHQGPQISAYAAENFAHILQKNPHFASKNYQSALRQTFINIDKMLISKEGNRKLLEIQKKIRGYSSAEICGLYTGSTGLVVLVTQQHIYIAHAGDSKAIIIQNDRIIMETVDHRPQNPKQQERILSQKGIIRNGRIQGNLSVSRGFGDYVLKSGNNPQENIVIVVPEISRIPRNKIQAILMGSDGIFQRPSNQVWQNFTQRPTLNVQAQQVSEIQQLQYAITNYFEMTLGKSKKQRNGTDNMTAILIKFNSDLTACSASS